MRPLIVPSSPLSVRGFTPNLGHPLARGLVGMWMATPGYNGFGGNKWFDISGRGNHGTLTNMDPAAAWSGDGPPGRPGSLVFDGTNDYVPVTPPIGTTNGTIAAWLWRARNTGNDEYSVAGRTSSGSRCYLAYWSVSSGAYLTGIGSNGALSTGGVTAGMQAWHHVMLTWSSGTYTFTLNGVQTISSTYSGSPDPGSIALGAPLFDGTPLAALYWEGKIAEVVLFPVALTSQQRMAFYLESALNFPTLLNRLDLFPGYAPAAGGGVSPAIFHAVNRRRSA